MITISRKVKDRVASKFVLEDVDILAYHHRRWQRAKKGVIVAKVDYEKKKVVLGWSLCNTTQGDEFDKIRGIQIALGRMEDNIYKLSDLNVDEFLEKKVPVSMHQCMRKVIDRCERMLKADKKKKKSK
jgi:hypothetical protein